MQIGSQNAQQINNVEGSLTLNSVTFGDMNITQTIHTYKEEILGKIDSVTQTLNASQSLNQATKAQVQAETEQFKRVIEGISDQNSNESLLLDQTKHYTKTLKSLVGEFQGAKDTFGDLIDIGKMVGGLLTLLW